MRNQLFDVLAISENKLDDNIDSTEMGIKGYKVLRRDRNRYGGGVLFFIKEKWSITCVKQHENLEVLQCDIKQLNSPKIKLGVVYRPPDTTVTMVRRI